MGTVEQGLMRDRPEVVPARPHKPTTTVRFCLPQRCAFARRMSARWGQETHHFGVYANGWSKRSV